MRTKLSEEDLYIITRQNTVARKSEIKVSRSVVYELNLFMYLSWNGLLFNETLRFDKNKANFRTNLCTGFTINNIVHTK